MKRISFLAFLLVFVSAMHAADVKKGYSIKVKIQGIKDTVCYMAGYYGPKQYFKDTTKVDANGNMVFEGKEPLPGGIYSIVLPDKQTYYEFVLVDQSFSMETIKGDQQVLTENLKVKGSPDAELFASYLKYINQKQKESTPFRKIVSDSLLTDDKKKESRAKLEVIDKEVMTYKTDFIKNNPNSFVTKIFLASQEPEIPEVWPTLPNGKKDSTFPRKYFLDHYWDNIDFSDERLLRTPILHNKLEKYITKIIVQHPDSINRAADYIIAKSKANKEIFKYFTHFITNHYEKSQIMGMDAVFVHLGEKYYMSGDAFWLDSTQMAKVTERVRKTKPTLLGGRTPNIILQDTAEKAWISLYDVKAPYTVLYFWDSGCGHCKKETPKLKNYYDKVKDKGIVVFAVGTELENKDWRKYIRENKLDWINVSDNPEINKNAYNYLNFTTIESLNFRDTYDIYSTPRVFLLDKDKKILAKRIGVDQLEELLDNLMKRDAKEAVKK